MSDDPVTAELLASEPALPPKQELIAKGMTKGLLQRLADNALRPAEEKALARVMQVVKLEQEGVPHRQIAERLGIHQANWIGYIKTNQFRIFRQHLIHAGRSLDAQAEEQQAQQRRAQKRRQYDRHDQDALDYVSFAYRRATKPDPKRGIQAGDFLDPDRAERMTKQVIQSQGWAEPIPTHVKPKDLTPGVVQAQMAAVRAADSREMVVRVTETTTVTEIAARETRQERQGEEIG